MAKALKITVGIVLLGFLIWGVFALVYGRSDLDNNGDRQNGGDVQPGPVVYKDLIKVTEPLPNQLIASPLAVRGEARGNWYFEATFPIRLLDGNGRELAVGYAEAQSDWMTTDFVPFKASFSFAAPHDTNEGILILEKSNPSALPEHADELKISVKFR